MLRRITRNVQAVKYSDAAGHRENFAQFCNSFLSSLHNLLFALLTTVISGSGSYDVALQYLARKLIGFTPCLLFVCLQQN